MSSKAKVLVVNAALASDVGAALNALDAQIVHASIEGDCLIRELTAGGLALIVLDLRASGHDGAALARRVRAAVHADQPPIVLIVSPQGTTADAVAAFEVGGVEVLSGPLSAEVLKRRIGLYLELHRRNEELSQLRDEAAAERALLTAVLDTIEDAIVACDADGVLTVFNRASRQLHGLPEQPIPAQEWAEHYSLYGPDGVTLLPTEQIPLLRAFRGEQVRNVEMVVSHKTGEQRVLSASGRPLLDAEGTIRGAVVSMHDVTALHQAEASREAAIRQHIVHEQSEVAAAAARESTERFSLLLNSSAEGIYGMAPDSTCIFLNTTGAKMLGYAPEELVGRPLHDVIHHHRADGSHYPQSECQIGKASRAGAFLRVDDEVFWHKNGSAVPVSYSVNPMVVGGRNAGSVITFTDVTQRRKAEEALRLSNERAQLATDAAGLGLFTWELASDSVTWHNDRPYEIFGLSKKAPPLNAERFIAEFVHPDDAPAFASAWSATLEQSAPFFFQGRIHRLPEREIRWVELAGQIQASPEGEPLRVVGTAADVTQSKLADEAVRASEERLRHLANTIPNLAWMADAEGWISWYNERWYAYTGTTPSEMEGWGWQKVHDPATLPEVLIRWKESIATGRAFEMTFPLRGADGEYRPFFTLVAPLRDATGKIVHWFGTNTDVSPLKKAEAELREADRRKDEFLAMLAHELRNPLAPIRNAAEILRRHQGSDERVAKASEIIARQVTHMSGLLNDLLDVSRVTRGVISLDKERVDMAVAIANAVEQVRPLIEAKGHRLSLENCQLGTYVFASPLRLTQVIANLLDNAAKYSPPHSAITIDVTRSSDNVVVSVSDAGIGISADLLPRVFEPFSQAQRGADRSQGGLGLGLAVVKGLIDLHGGSVTAHSDGAGHGSRFQVSLPAYDDAPVPAGGVLAPSMAAARSDRLRVLVVDDNVDAAESLALMLHSAEHRVACVFSATEAIKAIEAASFDVAVLDIGLPDMDGYQLAAHIRSVSSTWPVLIALSGYGQREDRAAALAAGFVQHLVKPVDPQALLQALSDCVGLGDEGQAAH
ncbi:MAG: PAS domain S-box protein [Cytophagales bacterium]|nr:PAS domain S-box protein [Rhizobacter sp.]